MPRTEDLKVNKGSDVVMSKFSKALFFGCHVKLLIVTDVSKTRQNLKSSKFNVHISVHL